MEFKSSLERVDTSKSKIANEENNDCVVMAVAAATEKSYDEAHAYCAKVFERKNGKGVKTVHLLKQDSFEMLSFTVKNVDKSNFQKKYKSKTRNNSLSTFIKNHQKGRYIVLVRNHAVALVDGVLYDSPGLLYKTSRKVIGLLELKAATK